MKKMSWISCENVLMRRAGGYSQPVNKGKQAVNNSGNGAAEFWLGNIRVDSARGVLVGASEECHLEPKVMALLQRLVASPGQVLSRRTLLDSVWPGVVVEDQVLTRGISRLRRALGDLAAAPTQIQTISKKGYRLVVDEPAGFDDSSGHASPFISPQAAVLAVLPLNVLSADERYQFLGSGIARDLTQLLSQVPGLRVISWFSAERISRAKRDLQSVSRALDCQFVVSGSIEIRGLALRLRVELIDTQANQQLWANRFDARLEELFSVQDELIEEIARSLSTALDVERVARIRSRGDFDLDAYQHIQLAEDARRTYGRSAADYVVKNLEAALAIQPENGVAHALLAMQLSQNLVSRWTDSPDATGVQMARHLQSALQLAPQDSRVLMAAGVSALMRGEHANARQYLQLSFDKNPNEPHTLAELGMTRYFVTRELEPSLRMIERAERSGRDHPRYGIWAYRRGICQYEAGNYAASVDAYDEAIVRMPAYHHVYMTKAVALARQGETGAASEAIQQGLGLAPDLSYSEYETGVLMFGLTIPETSRCVLAELWGEASRACAANGHAR